MVFHRGENMSIIPKLLSKSSVRTFFFIYSLWIWDVMLVLLENIRNNIETISNSKLLQFQWDKKAEKTEMSIITPAISLYKLII